MAVQRQQQRAAKSPDMALWTLIVALVVVGLLLVFDASYARSMDSPSAKFDPLFYPKRQAIYAVVGLIALAITQRFDYRKLRPMAPALMLGTIVLLICVWVPGIGVKIAGAHRWIGRGINIQPAEIAKITLILYLAAKLSERAYPIRDWKLGLVGPIITIGFTALLIEQEPDLGTASVLFSTGLLVLLLGGAKKRHIATVFTVATLFAGLMIMRQGYRGNRVAVWLTPDKYYSGAGYQVSRGLVAVGSGGVLGVGIGHGREKFYLPAANTDFIFATLAEETGLVGSLVLIGLLFFVVYQCFSIAHGAKDLFGALIATGVGSLIGVQSIINIAVVTGTIPATGVPLPFISYGGSSLLFLLIGIGLVLSVARVSAAERTTAAD
jgi:cell division protein FtsW